MKCPKCRAGHKRTRVTCTTHLSDHTIRYCRCLDCKHKWKTEEKIVKYQERPYHSGGWNAKLNKNKVKEIRRIAEVDKKAGIPKGDSIARLQIQYGVEFTTIRNVIIKKTWKHVD